MITLWSTEVIVGIFFFLITISILIILNALIYKEQSRLLKELKQVIGEQHRSLEELGNSLEEHKNCFKEQLETVGHSLEKVFKDSKEKDLIIQDLKKEKQRLLKKLKEIGQFDVYRQGNRMELDEDLFDHSFWTTIHNIIESLYEVEKYIESLRRSKGDLRLPEILEDTFIKMIKKLKSIM